VSRKIDVENIFKENTSNEACNFAVQKLEGKIVWEQFTQKLQVNFTNNCSEIESNIHINVKF